MRIAESINLAFFSFFILTAWLKGVAPLKRARITAVGLGGLCLSAGLHLSQFFLSPFWSSLLRDWMPAPMLLVVYWQAGLFAEKPNARLQKILEETDRKILGKFLRSNLCQGPFRWLARYFEFAYLFCYPLVPLGMGVLYWTHHRQFSDSYWTALLPSTYLCYVLIPFAQTLPPRLTATEPPPTLSSGAVRKLNLWILRHWSIQLNTFPSAHVASTMAASLVLLRADIPLGLLFLLISLSIGVGAILGRYHFAADVLLAVWLAVAIDTAQVLFLF